MTGGDVQIFRAQQELDVVDRPMNVEIAGPPSFRRQIGQGCQLNRFGRSLFVPDRSHAGTTCILRATLDLIAIFAFREVQRRHAGTNEMISPEWQRLRLCGVPWASRKWIRLATGSPDCLSSTEISRVPTRLSARPTPGGIPQVSAATIGDVRRKISVIDITNQGHADDVVSHPHMLSSKNSWLAIIAAITV